MIRKMLVLFIAVAGLWCGVFAQKEEENDELTIKGQLSSGIHHDAAVVFFGVKSISVDGKLAPLAYAHFRCKDALATGSVNEVYCAFYLDGSPISDYMYHMISNPDVLLIEGWFENVIVSTADTISVGINSKTFYKLIGLARN